MNYKQLCEYLGEPPIEGGGRNRQLHIERLGQFYEIQKVGRGDYNIVRKYSPEEVKTLEAISKYSDYISDSLVYYLSNVDGYSETITYYDMYEITKMVNSNYHKGKSNLNFGRFWIETQKFNSPKDEVLDIESDDVITSNLFSFFRISKNMLKKNIKNAVESMRKKKLIEYYETYVLYRQVQKDGVTYMESHTCNEKEASAMLDIFALGRELVGAKDVQQLYYILLDKSKATTYYDFVAEQIQQQFGYDMYTEAIHFILSKEALRIELKYNKSLQININVQNQMLNSNEIHKYIRQHLNEQFVKEYIKRC